jgi:hypothetical protein
LQWVVSLFEPSISRAVIIKGYNDSFRKINKKSLKVHNSYPCSWDKGDLIVTMATVVLLGESFEYKMG